MTHMPSESHTPQPLRARPGRSARPLLGFAVFLGLVIMTVAGRTTPAPAAAPKAYLVSTSAVAARADMRSSVRIANFAFAPATLRVARGQTVAWTNGDVVPHTVTSKDKRWDSGQLAPGSSYRVTFDRTGTYVYGCTIHPFMRATVVVGN